MVGTRILFGVIAAQTAVSAHTRMGEMRRLFAAFWQGARVGTLASASGRRAGMA